MVGAIAASKVGGFVSRHKVIIIVLIILVIVAVYFYRKGKKQTTIADLPEGEKVNAGQAVSTNDVVLAADQLHEDIHEIFGTRDTALYERLVLWSDTDLIRLYNVYNTKYQAQDKETLLMALKGEVTALFSSSAATNMQTLINRLAKHNVK